VYTHSRESYMKRHQTVLVFRRPFPYTVLHRVMPSTIICLSYRGLVIMQDRIIY
jgi:hypothetical protein